MATLKEEAEEGTFLEYLLMDISIETSVTCKKSPNV